MRIKVAEGEVVKFKPMSWPEEFDNEFGKRMMGFDTYKDIKAFIQSLLDRQKKERLGKADDEAYKAGWNAAISYLEAHR